MPVLIDTSVWIDHYRGGESSAALLQLLEEDSVRSHRLVVGELAMGNLPGPRPQTLASLERLPRVGVAPESRVREVVETHPLWGRGIGWADAHLVVAAELSALPFWTLDLRLQRIAEELGVAWRG